MRKILWGTFFLFLVTMMVGCSTTATVTQTIVVTDNTCTQQYSEVISQYIDLNSQLQIKLNEAENSKTEYYNKFVEYDNLEKKLKGDSIDMKIEIERLKAEIVSINDFSSHQDLYIQELMNKINYARSIFLAVFDGSDNISAANMSSAEKIQFRTFFKKWYLSDTIPDWLR